MSNQEIAVQKPVNVIDIVNFQEDTFKQVVSSDVMVWAKESQFAIQALQKNDFLNGVAWKNQASLQNAIINVASIGISLNPVKKHAYLVPRDGGVCLDISFMGLLHLAMQSGSIVWGQAKLVYANDNYVNTGVDTAPRHEQQTFGDKGDIVGVYCTIKTPSGDYLTEEMDMNVINKIKNASKAANGPWKTWPEEMMRKAVVKRASKYWPQNARVSEAVAVLNAHEGNEDAITNTEYTEEQKGLFDGYIAREDGLGLACFAQEMGSELMTALNSSFPLASSVKGQDDVLTLSKGKAIVKRLESEGHQVLDDYANQIKECQTNDDNAVLELTGELTDIEKRLVASRLSPETIEWLKGVKE